MTTLAAWQERIGAWHERAFAWAKIPHIMAKLQEEQREATLAWAEVSGGNLPDELADCLICVLAAMAREGIDAEAALASKFERVAAKYAEPQPAPHMRKLARRQAMIELNEENVERLKRLLDFVVTFHSDDLPENSPELTDDAVGLLRLLGDSGHFEFAEQLLNLIEAPAYAEPELPL